MLAFVELFDTLLYCGFPASGALCYVIVTAMCAPTAYMPAYLHLLLMRRVKLVQDNWCDGGLFTTCTWPGINDLKFHDDLGTR